MKNALSNFWNRLVNPGDIYRGPRGFSVQGGIVVSETTAMKVATYHRGIIYLSGTLAKMKINIKTSTREILPNDPVALLLNLRPNEDTNSMKFKLAIFQYALHYGNGYAEIERNGAGRPIGLVLIHPNRVTPKRDTRYKLYYEVYNQDEAPAIIRPRDMLHFTNLHTVDGICGLGLVAYAENSLRISAGADRMASGLFSNGGLPSGVVSHPKKLSDEAYIRMKESWRENNSGKNAGGIQILEEGVTFEALNMDPQVLQFLESRKFGVYEIARFLGVSPEILFVETTAKKDTEQINTEMSTGTISTLAKNFQAEIDCKLLNDSFGGKFSEFDLYSISRGDMNVRSQYFNRMMSLGTHSPNEVRELEGLPPYAGGDDKYIAVNNLTPTNRVNEVIDSQIERNTKSTTPADKSAEEKELAKALLQKVNRD